MPCNHSKNPNPHCTARFGGPIIPLTVKKNLSIPSHLLRILNLFLPLLFAQTTPAAELDLAPPVLAVPYGENAAAGAYASVNGIKLYYEIYCAGQPMLQIHGNVLSISSMG